MEKPLPRFTIVAELNQLTRHLRLAGFDCVSSEAGAETIPGEERISLTRDKVLTEKLGPESAYLVPEGDPATQLRSVLERFQLAEQVRSEKGFLTRCLECNHPLLPVKPHHVHALVPGNILLEFDDFRLCTRCERVFWMSRSMIQMKDWLHGLVSAS